VSASKYKAYSDPELISMCLKGDGTAWETLITRYRRLVYSVPVRFHFEAADAADVFQSVCLKLLEHLHEIKDERRISGWLVTTTVRECMYLRQLKARETTREEDNLAEPADPALNLEEVRILTEEQQALREAVDELPDRCRSLVHMLYFDHQSFSYDEISSTIGIPVSSIGPTRARCFEKLRAILRRRRIQ
jgi:RNA polymerase sigma factor (sigma-70 family)